MSTRMRAPLPGTDLHAAGGAIEDEAVPRIADRLLRAMQPDDLDAVLAIEQRAYSHPWTRGNFADSLAHGSAAECMTDRAGALLGYFVALPGVEELHLLNLTVAPRWQRQGLGGLMLQRVAQLALQRGDTTIWLEVRRSNHAALALYRGAGFDEVGERRAYYPAAGGREDAVVMRGSPALRGHCT